MVRYILKRILRRRHFWRDVGFDELTELYISSMLRTFALSLLMVFLPYYLYQNGYDFQGIFVFFGVYFIGKAIADIGAGYYVARFGPKHSIAVSYCLQIIGVALLLTLPAYHWPSWLIAPLLGSAASFFFVAYHVEFSKIKHADHAGKELGEMLIFERIAMVAGPLFGGVAGSLLGPQYIFAIASVVLFVSLIPLFRTAEPVRTHQHLQFDGLPLARLKWDYASYVALGVENTLCLNLWPLYLSLFALGGSVYASLGVLTSLSVLVSISAAYMFGRYVDQRNARQLLRAMATLNAVNYLFRPLVGNALQAFAVNVVNETVTTGYRMPYTKGMYAAADDLPGNRIAYLSTMECLGSITKGTAWFLLAVLCLGFSGKHVIFIGFAIAAAGSLFLMIEHFSALKPRRVIL